MNNRIATWIVAGLTTLPAIGQTPLTLVRVAPPTPSQTAVQACAIPGDGARFFVVNKNGEVLVFRDGQRLPRPFLDITSRVIVGQEQGLLSLAFHPDYARNGHCFVNYTRAGDGATIIERYTVSSNPDVLDPGSRLLVFGPIAQPQVHHNGGGIRFGPDGYLYVGMGDGGGNSCSAQDGTLLLGKMLRLDVDTPGSVVPPSNPFVSNPSVRDEIWAVGCRNPWRFAFDRVTGDLWIADVGWRTKEEIDFQSARSAGGENYGWPVREGTDCRTPCTGAPPCSDPRFVDPIHEYGHTGSNCSIVGGIVYRGCAIPDLRGTYFFGDFCAGGIWSLRYDGTAVSEHTDRKAELDPTNQVSWITSIDEDANGEILITTSFRGVWRIVPDGPAAARDLGFGTVGGNGRIPRFEVCGVLVAGATAELRLEGAAPNAPAAMLLGLQQNPTPFPPFGTLVPNPPALAVGFGTDATGGAALRVRRTGSATILYGQCAVVDAGGPGGIALSNALQITIP